MLKRIPKIFLSIILGTIALVAGMITILQNWESVCSFYSLLSNKISQLMSAQMSVLIVIIVLSALNFLNLTFYLLCNYRKSKNINSSKNIKLKNKDNHIFFPTSEMIEIMLLLKDDTALFQYEINSKLQYSIDNIIYLISKLQDNKLIENYLSNDVLYSFSVDNHGYRLQLSSAGRTYLIENNLI